MAHAELTRKVAMCFMAHPDDCEILAAATLIHLAKKGWEIHMVTSTPGDCGSMEQGPEQIAAIRRKEGLAAALKIGGHYHCLEERDLCVYYNDKTVKKAASLMRAVAPSLVITHSLVDYMMDHEETAKIVRGATFGYAIPNFVNGPIAQGSIVPWLYYADPIEGLDVYGKKVPPSTYVNVTDTMDQKIEALCEHASQREWLRAHHGMDQYVAATKEWGSHRGGEASCTYAEAFRQHKGHPYPQSCLLQQELGDLVTHAE